MELKITLDKDGYNEEYVEKPLYEDLYNICSMCFSFEDDKTTPSMERFSWFFGCIVLFNNHNEWKYRELYNFLQLLWENYTLEKGDITIELTP